MYCTWKQAQAFAVWAGGRLPLAEELGVLYEADPSATELPIFGEYVSNLDIALDPTKCTFVMPERWLGRRNKQPMTWLEVAERDNLTGEGPDDLDLLIGAGFRVVFPKPE